MQTCIGCKEETFKLITVVKEEFLRIVDKGTVNQAVSFLQSLTPEERKKLAPVVKDVAKDYLKAKTVQHGTTFSSVRKANEHQRIILLISGLTCVNRTDFEKFEFPGWVLQQNILDHVVNWYLPSWFSEFVNKLADTSVFPHHIDYDWVMRLTTTGKLQPSETLVTQTLTRVLLKWVDRKQVYTPEKLIEHPMTLNVHVWYLFYRESDITYGTHAIYGSDKKQPELGWKKALIDYSHEGRISRQRLLQEALLASNRNFNKNLSGWFAEFFTEINPTTVELLSMQKELLGVLNSPHSKVVNTGISHIKKILAEKEFDVAGFLDTAPVLLASDTKATVNGALQVLEKIAKKHKAQAAGIAQLSCQALVHADDALQQRAAKLISTIYTEPDEQIQQQLEPYSDSLFSSARGLLDHLLTTTVNMDQHTSDTVTRQPIHAGPEPIPPVASIDDLVFLASQAFDNNEPWHISVLPAELIKWQTAIRPEQLAKFEPALQTALKLVLSRAFISQLGALDSMLAHFFVDVCMHWIKQFPEGSQPLKKLFKTFGQEPSLREWLNLPKSSYLASWRTHGNTKVYQAYKELFAIALKKIASNDSSALLSAPTHAPAWIDPLVLVKRLHEYGRTNVASTYAVDLQVAIMRCNLQDTREAIRFTEEHLNGEFKSLLLFLFDKDKDPRGPFNHQAAWMMASLAKTEKKTYPEFRSFPWYKTAFANYTGQLQWESVREDYTYEQYNYQTRKNEPVQASRKTLRVLKDKTVVNDENIFKKFFQRIIKPSTEADQGPALCEWMEFGVKWIGNQANDVQRLLLLTPNNPEPLLAQFINQSLSNPVFNGEGFKQFTMAVLQTMHGIWHKYGEMGHLLVGTCMTNSDKTITNIAAEIWINGVINDSIDSKRIGQVIGRQQSIEFVPLKRFTDLAMQSLFRISPQHNRMLQVIIENMIAELPGTAIKGLKKLLEILMELSSINKQPIEDKRVKNKLELWKETEGLKKLVEGFQ